MVCLDRDEKKSFLMNLMTCSDLGVNVCECVMVLLEIDVMMLCRVGVD